MSRTGSRNQFILFERKEGSNTFYDVSLLIVVLCGYARSFTDCRAVTLLECSASGSGRRRSDVVGRQRIVIRAQGDEEQERHHPYEDAEETRDFNEPMSIGIEIEKPGEVIGDCEDAADDEYGA